jgi:hypothetical protein
VLVFTTLTNLLGTKCLDYPEKCQDFFYWKYWENKPVASLLLMDIL